MKTLNKLALNKETLISLNDQASRAVAGGIAPPPDYTERCTVGCGFTNQCHWTVQATNCSPM